MANPSATWCSLVDGFPADPEPHWFQLDDQEPIADYGLVVGCEPGKRYSAEISVEEMRKRVTFARGDCHTVFANMLK